MRDLRVTTFIREDDGATMVEYAVMLGAIAVVCVLAVIAVGAATRANFERPELAAP